MTIDESCKHHMEINGLCVKKKKKPQTCENKLIMFKENVKQMNQV